MFDDRLSQAGNVCGNGFLLFSPACLLSPEVGPDVEEA